MIRLFRKQTKDISRKLYLWNEVYSLQPGTCVTKYIHYNIVQYSNNIVRN